MTDETFVEKEPLILREYGRNVQKLVQYITTLPTIEERTQASHTLINLMKQLNPSVREHNDNMQRIWDHLHHMANFELDINSPFPVPTPENIFQKPQALPYTNHTPKYKHYGKNIELLVEKACTIEDQESLLQTVKFIVQLMKSFYAAWNNDNIEDEVLLSHIRNLSGGKIKISAHELQDVDSKGQRRQPAAKTQGNGYNSRNNRTPETNNRTRNTEVRNNMDNNRNHTNRNPQNNDNNPNNEKRTNNYRDNNKNIKK
jgi:hypothetical protein